MNIFRIIKGWGRRFGIISTSTAEQKLSDLRLKSCKVCPQASKSKILQIIDGKAKYPESLVCDFCGCPCWEKSLVVDEVCPMNKW